MVNGNAVQSGVGSLNASEEIAAADNNADLNAATRRLSEIAGDTLRRFGIEPETGLAGQCLATEFEEDATIALNPGLRCRSYASASPTLNRAMRLTTIFSPSFETFWVIISPTVAALSFTKGCSSRHTSS